MFTNLQFGPLEINCSIHTGKEPRGVSLFTQVFYTVLNLVPVHDVKHVGGHRSGHLDPVPVRVDVVVDDVVRECNLLERLRTSHYDFTRAKYARRHLLHVFGRLEFDLDSRVPVRIKGYAAKDGVATKSLGSLHQVDVVVETKVGVDHHDAKAVAWNLSLEDSAQNKGQLLDDVSAIKQVRAPRNLHAAVGENLDRLGAVLVRVPEGHLVVKRRRLQLPFETIGGGPLDSNLDRPTLLKLGSKLVNVNVL